MTDFVYELGVYRGWGDVHPWGPAVCGAGPCTQLGCPGTTASTPKGETLSAAVQ